MVDLLASSCDCSSLHRIPFSDLCQTCVDGKCVLLSLESIEKRLSNPKAYYIFYIFFYKAAVGEARWKECLEMEEGRIGNNNTEAFALLLFSNNFKAWLYEEKERHGDALMTEYDTTPTSSKKSIVDSLLQDLEIVLRQPTTADALVENPVVKNKQSSEFKSAVKARKDWHEEFKRLPAFRNMRQSWETSTADTALQGALRGSTITNSKERARKKRKHMKGMRKWTGVANDGERKFKGWSDKGHEAYVKWTVAIKDDVDAGRYSSWEKAIRQLQREVESRSETESGNATKYAVDTTTVWEL